jgi:GNAT superfamily N-acetyltransferase
MGDAYVHAFIRWFCTPDGARVALAAVDASGEVVGYVFGAPLGYAISLNRDLARPAARALFMRPWVVFRQEFQEGFLARLALLLGRPPAVGPTFDLPSPTMSAVGLGVSPTARRKRVGLRLLQAFEIQARDLGMLSLRASPRSDNLAVHRLFERCGWQLSATSGSRAYYSKILPR